MSSFAISQILAGIAFAIGLASVQFKSRRHVLLCLVFSTALSGAHFFVLDRPAPGSLMLLTGIRYIVALQTTDRKALLFFLVVSCVTFAATFESRLSLVALCGTLVGTYGSFQPAGRKVRLYFMGGNVAWLSHNILVWTPVGIANEVLFLGSGIVGFWRYYGSPFRRDGERSDADIEEAGVSDPTGQDNPRS